MTTRSIVSLISASTSAPVRPTTVVCMICTTSPVRSMNVLVMVSRSRPPIRRTDDSSTSLINRSPVSTGLYISKT